MIAIHLPVARYRFSLRADSEVQLPAYAGSAWRGLFGKVLKRSVCVTHAPECRGCLLWRQCVYSYVFETPPPPEPDTILRDAGAAPHPFVIRPLATSGGRFARGDLLAIELVLVGRANEYLPYIVHSFNEMGKAGITRREGRFHIESVSRAGESGAWDAVYTAAGRLENGGVVPVLAPQPEVCSAVRVSMLTPYRSVQRGHLIRAADFSAQQFLGTLLRRVSMLQAYHTDVPLAADFKALKALMATLVAAENRLHWHDWARYSNRQQTLIKMGGLLGSVVLRGEALGVFMPLLRAGEVVHAGKAAVMGLGEFRLDVV